MILETDRLVITELTTKDAPFFFELVNDPAWIKYIGDREIYTISDAEDYLNSKIIASYANNGFGFYLVSLKNNNLSIGITGLINRKGLEHVDVGIAFLESYRSKGFAYESTSAILDFAKRELGIDPILAITDLNNSKSIKLLERLGMRFEKIIQLPDDEKKCRLFKSS